MWKTILVSSGYGANTRKPFVMIEMEELDRPIQISPEEARKLALNLLECSEASETDQFIVEFFEKKLGFSLKEAVSLLSAFREFRDPKE